MIMYRNFTLDEFVHSDTADRLGIDNTPPAEAIAHLGELVGGFLQPFRDWWGKPIIVTSGYRCPQLNAAVGGSDTSVHPYGWAADIQPKDMDEFPFFAESVKSWAADNDIRFDQMLIERSKTAQWVHIGYRNRDGEQRRAVKMLEV